MDRLERLVSRRRRLVLIAWLVVVVVSVPFAGRQTENLTGGGFETAGSGSQLVADSLGSDFEGTQAESLSVVIDNRAGDPAKLAAAVDRVQREGFEDVDAVRLDPAAAEAAKASTDPIVIMPLIVEGDRDEAVDAASVMREHLHTGEAGEDLPVHLLGQSALWAGIQELSKKDLEQAEIIGLPIVLIILLFVFGSLAAAALPLALGVASVVVTGAIVFFLSQVYGMSTFVTNMASMLGIGVAVDYSLFILARYREELENGLSASEAREVAMRTSGMAVTFSGLTVIVALAGLFLIDAKVVQSMAVGAIVVVGIAVIAAITLLPALIAALGHRVARAREDHRAHQAQTQAQGGPGVLGAVDGDADAPPAAVRARRDRAHAPDRLARAGAEGEHRRDRDVPEGLRDPRGLRARGAAARRRGRARADPAGVRRDERRRLRRVGHRAAARREGGVARRPLARREEDARRRHPRRVAGERGDPRARRSIA